MNTELDDKLISILKDADVNTYPLFSLKDYITYGKLLSNYDGDTGNILLLYKGNFMNFKVRFFGYDSCEIRQKLNDPHRDEKKKKAQDAKLKLWQLCTKLNDLKEKSHSTLVKIKCGDFDKYGRLLVTVFNINEDISDNNVTDLFKKSINYIMIKEGYGYEYYGGTKNSN
jgi:endonuclease YncB( thermonuclease family)